MNEVLAAIRPDLAPHRAAQLHGDTYLGNAIPRTSMTKTSPVVGRIENRDQIFSMADVIGISSRQVLGKRLQTDGK